LKRQVDSHQLVDLDEDVTADRAAEDGLWLPYTRPARERWLDLILVVDEPRIMQCHQPEIADFAAALKELGAFRDVRVRFLSQEADPGGPQGWRPVLGGVGPESVAADPAELVDPAGRRAVLVVTDGLGPLWETGAVQRALELWGRTGPTALVHLLPAHRWAETPVAPRRVQLTAPRRAATNRELTVTVPDEWRNPFEPLTEGWRVAVPVLEMAPDWLAWWARLVAGDQPRQVPATVLLLGGKAVAEATEPDRGSIEERGAL